MRTFLAMILLAGIASPAYSISQEQWIETMSNLLPEALCQNDYYSQCFKATKKECLRVAENSLVTCSENYRNELPVEFDQENGAEWGKKLGACTGRRLDYLFSAKKVHNARCDDRSVWVSTQTSHPAQ